MAEVIFETITGNHPVGKLANTLSDMAFELAAHLRMSKMDVCSALANACGQILADAAVVPAGGKALPREEALNRMDALRKVMESAYDLRSVKGSS